MTTGGEIIWCYVPVIHEGYLRWFSQHPRVPIALVTPSEIEIRRDLLKDIRRLDVTEVQAMLALTLDRQVSIGWKRLMRDLPDGIGRLIMPDEPVMHELSAGLEAEFDLVFEPAFLRWHAGNVELEQEVDVPVIGQTKFERELWSSLGREAQRSADWWRQVACAVVRDEEVILSAINTLRPDEYVVSYLGDPRAIFNKGVKLELAHFIHAEATVIAQAARRGIPLAGAELYVSTFPCPSCAKLVAEAGFARVIYRAGYSVLDGETVLTAAGIQIERFNPEAE